MTLGKMREQRVCRLIAYYCALALMLTVLLTSYAVFAEEEITLFDARGMATAYIAVDDDLTLYLWSGKPVAYLEGDSEGGFHIYGFNGNHLGWFVQGVIRDHEGDAACATKEHLGFTEFEPFKSFKAFKPFKSFKAIAPFRPFFTTSWGDMPCGLFLAQGS
jgi:4-fold beta flower protein